MDFFLAVNFLWTTSLLYVNTLSYFIRMLFLLHKGPTLWLYRIFITILKSCLPKHSHWGFGFQIQILERHISVHNRSSLRTITIFASFYLNTEPIICPQDYVTSLILCLWILFLHVSIWTIIECSFGSRKLNSSTIMLLYSSLVRIENLTFLTLENQNRTKLMLKGVL